MSDPEFLREIDYRALNFYLTLGYIPFDMTIFRYAKKLPPAHIMVYDIRKRDYSINRYWEIPLCDNKSYSQGELVERMEGLLKDAVKSRLVSDVPLGAFLSGGLDSSLIVAMMSQVSDKPVKTFSIGFEHQEYNELPFAKSVANIYD